MRFTTRKMVQFSNCDPFGIVFYPQYFYILSEAKEDFLTHIGHPHHHYINELHLGWPMVRLETDFKRPSKYGDQINVEIAVFKLGGSSLGLEYTIRGDDGQERMVTRTVIVLTDMQSGQPVPMGDGLRTALTRYLNA